jgi:hypothetical protein
MRRGNYNINSPTIEIGKGHSFEKFHITVTFSTNGAPTLMWIKKDSRGDMFAKITISDASLGKIFGS